MHFKRLLKIPTVVLVLGLICTSPLQTYANFIKTVDYEVMEGLKEFTSEGSDELESGESDELESEGSDESESGGSDESESKGSDESENGESDELESGEPDELDIYGGNELEREQYPDLELNDNSFDKGVTQEDSGEEIEVSNVDLVTVSNETQLRNALNAAPTDGTLIVVEVDREFELSSRMSLVSGTNIMLRSNNINQSRTLRQTERNMSHFEVTANASFTLGNGIILTSVHIPSGDIGGVNVGAGGEFTMTGGEIFRNTGTQGGGVSVFGTFTMEGGTIRNNRSEQGAGVFVSGGEFRMTNGDIINNEARQTGGGVMVSNGTFTMDGGTISDNGVNWRFEIDVLWGGGGVSVSNGEFTMLDGDITDNRSITNGGGVLVLSGGTFTMERGTISGNTANSGNSFNSNGGGVLVSNGTFTMEGGDISRNTATNTGGGVLVNRNGEFRMTDGEISGNSASTGGGVQVDNGGQFRMINGEISGINVTTHNVLHGIVQVTGRGSEFTMEGGMISGTPDTVSTGVLVRDGEFTMEGGKISGHIISGISVEEGGKFSMTGGEISGNSASTGGGVLVNTDGEFRMTGGEISDNTASEGGGGVLVSRGTFTMEGGTISNNDVITSGNPLYDWGGGGVSVLFGEFTMKDGDITGNRSNLNGGGVMVLGSTSTFTMEGGTISDNDVTWELDIDLVQLGGGGVYVSSNGEFTMKDGDIIDNRSTINGGGVSVDYGTFTMEGGTISGNTANSGNSLNSNGGGVMVSSSTFTMEGGDISRNTAKNTGGGIYVGGTLRSHLFIDGGEVTLNEADVVGGIYVSSEEILNNTIITRDSYVADNKTTANMRMFNNLYNETHNINGNGRINPLPWDGLDNSHVFNTVDMNTSSFKVVVRLKNNFEASNEPIFREVEFNVTDLVEFSPQFWDEHIAGNIPTRIGYKFNGWSFTPEGEIIDHTQLSNEVILKDLNLYAQWEIDPTYLNVSIPTEVFFESNHEDATQLVSPTYTITNHSTMGVHVDIGGFKATNDTSINVIEELNVQSTSVGAASTRLITNGSIEPNSANSRLLALPGSTSGGFEFSGRANVTTEVETPSFNLTLSFEVVPQLSHLLVDKASTNETIRYPQSEATMRVNGVIGLVENPIVEDEITDLEDETTGLEEKNTDSKYETTGLETRPVKPGEKAPGLAETGATMANMSVVGLGVLLVAGITVYLKNTISKK